MNVRTVNSIEAAYDFTVADFPSTGNTQAPVEDEGTEMIPFLNGRPLKTHVIVEEPKAGHLLRQAEVPKRETVMKTVIVDKG